LMNAVIKLEGDVSTFVPYHFVEGNRSVYFIECRDEARRKIVFIIPEQVLTETAMERFCEWLYAESYEERVVYMNDTRFSLGRAVAIHPLPRIIDKSTS